MMRACPSCSALSDTDKAFCPECGAGYARASSKPAGRTSGLGIASMVLGILWLILAGIPSCSHLRAHLAFSDSKGLFDQRTRNGDSRSNAGLDRNRSSANWSCRWLIKAGRCAERRERRCSGWFPCLGDVPVSAVLWPKGLGTGCAFIGTPPRRG